MTANGTPPQVTETSFPRRRRHVLWVIGVAGAAVVVAAVLIGINIGSDHSTVAAPSSSSAPLSSALPAIVNAAPFAVVSAGNGYDAGACSPSDVPASTTSVHGTDVFVQVDEAGYVGNVICPGTPYATKAAAGQRWLQLLFGNITLGYFQVKIYIDGVPDNGSTGRTFTPSNEPEFLSVPVAAKKVELRLFNDSNVQVDSAVIAG